MFVRITFDIENRTPVYAICDSVTQRCHLLTNSITQSILYSQCRNVNELKQLLAA